MSGLSHLVTVVAAIKACVALQHFAIFAAGGGRRRDLAFAITCGCIAGYDLAAAALYRSTSVAEAAEFQHLQVAALVAGSAAFLWFTAEYTRQIPRRLAWLAGGMLTATALVALFDRSGLVFDASRAAVKRVTLPFGPELIYVEAAAGPLVVVQSVIGIGVLAGAVAAAVRQFRGGERREAGPLLFALAVLSLAVVSDGAVATGLYTFPYTLEFAYLSLVVVMALTLVRQLAQAAALEARLRENEARLRHAERLESLGTLAGGVAHDFNNLLAPIMGHAELALDQLDRDHPARADLVGILRAGESAARLTRQLLQVAAGPGSGSGPTDLETLLRDFRPVLRGLLGHRIRLETEVEPGLPPVPLDPGHAQQILLNLAVNARDAMPAGGAFRITVRRGPEGWVRLAARDTGCGMDVEVAKRAFDPFFTTRDRGRGTGLGLATVHRIVVSAGGEIHLASRPGEGACFEITLPAAPAATTPPRDPVPTGPEPRRPAVAAGRTVLTVEDDPAVRAMLRRALDRAGYRVIDAETPERGLELEARHAGPIACLLGNVLMPGMDGYRLAEVLRKRRPGIGVVLISGHTDDRAPEGSRAAPCETLLRKPFSARALVAAVDQAVRRAGRPPVAP